MPYAKPISGSVLVQSWHNHRFLCRGDLRYVGLVHILELLMNTVVISESDERDCCCAGHTSRLLLGLP